MKRILIALSLVVVLLAPVGTRASTDEEKVYVNQLLVLAQVVSETYNYSADLAANPQPSDPVWMAQFVSIWSTMEILQRAIVVIDVPPEFAGSFGYFSDAIDVMANNASFCRTGIVNMMASRIDTCTGYVQQANSLITLATTTLTSEAEALGIGR